MSSSITINNHVHQAQIQSGTKVNYKSKPKVKCSLCGTSLQRRSLREHVNTAKCKIISRFRGLKAPVQPLPLKNVLFNQQLQQTIAIKSILEKAESEEALTQVSSALAPEEKQDLAIDSSLSLNPNCRRNQLAHTLIPAGRIEVEFNINDVQQQEALDLAKDGNNININLQMIEELAESDFDGIIPNTDDTASAQAHRNEDELKRSSSTEAMEESDSIHERSPDLKQSNSFNPSVVPCALRSLYTQLCHWRLRNVLSRTCFEELLVLIKNHLLLKNEADTINLPFNSASENGFGKFGSSFKVALDSAFSCVNSLPTSEYKLFSLLGLHCKDNELSKYAYVLCPNSECGALYHHSSLKEMSQSQLAQGKINHKKAVYCSKCHFSLYYQDLQSTSGGSSQSKPPQKKRKRQLNVPQSSKSTSYTHCIPSHSHIPAHPLMRPFILSVKEFIKLKSRDSTWWISLDMWKSSEKNGAVDSADILGDVHQGSFWTDSRFHEFLRPDDPAFPSGIALTLHADGFQQNSKGLKSIWGIYLTINNLPRGDRMTNENTLLYALIPGVGSQQCSENHIRSVLGVLVQELKELQFGYKFLESPGESAADVIMKKGTRAVFLFNVVCDQPALRKICGFGGITGTFGCTHCTENIGKTSGNRSEFYQQSTSQAAVILNDIQHQIEHEKKTKIEHLSDVFHQEVSSSLLFSGPQFEHIKDTLVTGVDAATSVHVKIDWRQMMTKYLASSATKMHMRNSDTVKAQMKEFAANMLSMNQKDFKDWRTKQLGVTYTPLIELDYFDPINSSVIDVMHTLWLGVTKRYFAFLRHVKGGLPKASGKKNKLMMLSRWINRIDVPHDIGRMPGKWTGKFGFFKAIEWVNFSSIFAVAALIAVGVQPCYILPVVFLQRVSYLLRLHTISRKQIKEVEENIQLFIMFSVWVLGPKFICPNLHLLRHIPGLLYKFGPACNWWCFPYERFTGKLTKLPRNEGHVIASMMHSWMKYTKISEYFMFICKQSSALESMIKQHYISQNQLKLFEQLSEQHPLHMPGFPHCPSAFYQASSFEKAQRGKLAAVIGSDNELATEHEVMRKINSQGATRGITYRLDINNFQRLTQLHLVHENIVKGFEPIPWFPRESQSKLSKQWYTFYQRKLQLQKAKNPNLDSHDHVNVRDVMFIADSTQSQPPHLAYLTSDSLASYYSSRYILEKDYNQSSDPSPSIMVFKDIPDNGELLQLYRQVDICGELYSSEWFNKNSGFFMCTLSDDDTLYTGKLAERYGQCCFFFKHSLTLKNNEVPAKSTHVEHVLAFVRLFKSVKLPQLDLWEDPSLSILSKKKIEQINKQKRQETIDRKASLILANRDRNLNINSSTSSQSSYSANTGTTTIASTSSSTLAMASACARGTFCQSNINSDSAIPNDLNGQSDVDESDADDAAACADDIDDENDLGSDSESPCGSDTSHSSDSESGSGLESDINIDDDDSEEAVGIIAGLKAHDRATLNERLSVSKACRHALYSTLKQRFPVIWLKVPKTEQELAQCGLQTKIKYMTETQPKYAIIPIHKIQNRVIISQTHESIGVVMSVPPKRHA